PEYNKPSRFRPNPPKAEVTWVQPKLVAEISYAEETKDGAIRHPSFEGLREDKNPLDVTREKERQAEEVIGNENQKTKNAQSPVDKSLINPLFERSSQAGNLEKSKSEIEEIADDKLQTDKLFKPSTNTERKTLLNPKDKSQVRNINGRDIKLNNLDKIYFPFISGIQ